MLLKYSLTETKTLCFDSSKHMDKLSVDLRIAWSLRHLHKESLEDVAQLAGCSLATAKRRIAAAEQRIRAELSDD